MDSETDALINQSGNRKNLGNKYTQSFQQFIQPCLAEFVAVMLFVFVGTMAVKLGDPPAIALAHGLTIVIFVTVTANISGGHINPAVTFAMAVTQEMSILLALGYFIFQILGALVGATLTRIVLTDDVYKNISGGGHRLAAGVDPGSGILCEIVLTTVLVLTILHVAVDPKTKSNLAPLAIGFAVVVDILAGISITGASMNPARSFGPAVVLSTLDSSIWDNHYVYWVGPILGSLMACIIYKFVLADNSKRLILKNE